MNSAPEPRSVQLNARLSAFLAVRLQVLTATGLQVRERFVAHPMQWVASEVTTVINTLIFNSQTHVIQLPTLSVGFKSGILLNIWVRRSSEALRQRIVELGTEDGCRVVLGTGDQPDTLVLSVEDGTNRREIAVPGALPNSRWVQVTASAGSFGAGWISLFGIRITQGTLLPLRSGALTRCTIGGGTSGSQFQGRLSQLEISHVPAIGNPVRWATYPLAQSVFDHTEQGDDGPVDVYRVDDTGPNNQDGKVIGALTSAQYVSLAPGSVPVLDLREVTNAPKEGLQLSSLGKLNGALTFEAWVCPGDATKQQPVLRIGSARRQLVLCVGGSSKEISLLLVVQNVGYLLMSRINAVESGVFSHIAVSLRSVLNENEHNEPDVWVASTEISLFQNGQLKGSMTIPVPEKYLVLPDLQSLPDFMSVVNGSGFPEQKYLPWGRELNLNHLLLGELSLPCALGGTIQLSKLSTIPTRLTRSEHMNFVDSAPSTIPLGFFAGQISEVRLWNDALLPATLASRFLGRMIGNEPALAGCYHLEQSSQGYTYDISARRGLGMLQAGSKIVQTTALPILPTRGNVYLDVKGKLVSETFNIKSTSSASGVQVSGQFFDATFVARQESTRTTLGGIRLYIQVDSNVTAFVPIQGGLPAMQSWIAGKVYGITLPADGKIRLRFKATDITFPTLRACVDGMETNIWTLVRPDREALSKLAESSGASLRTPPNGRRSPLPASMSEADAEDFSSMLGQIGSVYGPRPTHEPSQRFITEFVSAASDAWDATTGYVSSQLREGEQLVNGLIKLSSTAGAYANALIDNGTAALESATSTVTNVTSMVVSTATDQFDQLVDAASRATARYGKSALDACIKSANTMAVLAESVGDAVTSTLVFIGSSILDGVTYVWRVVCSGVQDAFDAVKAFIEKIGAAIVEFIEYLAWLFKWHDFVVASDEIYDDLKDNLNGINSQVNGLSQYRSQLNQYLTLPSNVGDKSLSQICHFSLPVMPGSEELEYVLEAVTQIFGATNLSIDGLDGAMGSLSGVSTKLGDAATPSINPQPSGLMNILGDPSALLTTKVQDLVNTLTTGSPSTSIVDYLYDTMLPAVKTSVSGLTSVLTARISVPGVTELLETIMEGRTLNILRLAAFISAIAKVLALKISASARAGSMSPQPASYSTAQEDMRAAAWASFAFGMIFGVLEGIRAALELKASSPALKMQKASLDAILGLLVAGRASCTYGMIAAQPTAAQATMGIQASMELIGGVSQIGFAARNYFTGGLAEKAALGTQAIVAVVLIIDAIVAASLGAYTSDTDWAKFAMQTSATVFAQLAVVLGLAVDQSGSGGKVVVPAQVALGTLTAVCDLALAGLDAATGSGATN